MSGDNFIPHGNERFSLA